MPHASLEACLLDLERRGQLVRVRETVDPRLEMAEIQRRAYRAQAPALLFESVKGCRFRAAGNIFGTIERCRLIFGRALERVRRIVRAKADPSTAWRDPLSHAMTPWAALKSLPVRWPGAAPVLEERVGLGDLPQIVSWPDDGGPFITLPQVYTESPSQPGVMRSNLGMYRIQLGGNRYGPGEIGLHYQLHRGIGVHHTEAVERGEPLRVSIFVGGPPAHTLAAVMPLPEGLSELLFAGMLAGRHFRYRRDPRGYLISSDADFSIVGKVDPRRTLPEGPFGDHLGYYSLAHEFPVLEVEDVWARRGAIWPFTVVGRPPQEDTSFGQLIHEITAPMVPKEIPGVKALHAVDAAGVHPLLLAIGSERYVPWGERVPRELLTIANAILGFGQCSLAKYLLIAAKEDDPSLDVHRIEDVLRHVLERIDLRRDLHFHTRTTIDTLDYSGTGLNEGSKLVIAAAGEPRRELARGLPERLRLPNAFPAVRAAMDGVLVVEGPPWGDRESARATVHELAGALGAAGPLDGHPLVVLVDDAEFTARRLENFLWVTFTRSNPSHDVHGVGESIVDKHWGADGPLIIDARLKPHHAPPLVEDRAVSRRVDELASRGKSLHGVIGD